MTTESDIEELKGAVGDLANAVEELADAVKEGPFSDSATKRAAVSVSKTARNIASQIAGRPAGLGAATVPEDVAALARAGKTLEAVKRYHEVSGTTLDEAQAVIRDIN